MGTVRTLLNMSQRQKEKHFKKKFLYFTKPLSNSPAKNYNTMMEQL